MDVRGTVALPIFMGVLESAGAMRLHAGTGARRTSKLAEWYGTRHLAAVHRLAGRMRLEVDDQAVALAEDRVLRRCTGCRRRRAASSASRGPAPRPACGCGRGGRCCGRWRAAFRPPGRRRASGSRRAGSTRTSSGPRASVRKRPRAAIVGSAAELHVVLAVAVARPDVEQRAGQRLAAHVGHAAHVERRLARHAFADVGAQRQLGCAGPVERAFDRGLGRLGRALRTAAGARLRQRDHHHRQAQRVGQQDELGPLVGRDLSRWRRGTSCRRAIPRASGRPRGRRHGCA